jgi:hypothetical protein
MTPESGADCGRTNRPASGTPSSVVVGEPRGVLGPRLGAARLRAQRLNSEATAVRSRDIVRPHPGTSWPRGDHREACRLRTTTATNLYRHSRATSHGDIERSPSKPLTSSARTSPVDVLLRESGRAYVLEANFPCLFPQAERFGVWVASGLEVDERRRGLGRENDRGAGHPA